MSTSENQEIQSIKEVSLNGEVYTLKDEALREEYYNNRTHWVEGGLVEILPEINPEFDVDNNQFILGFDVGLDITPSDPYIVYWNGTQYNTTLLDFTFMYDGLAAVGGCCYMLGDIYTMSNGEFGMASTGEPFAIMYLYIPGESVECGMQIIPLDGCTSLTLAIYQDDEVIHKLDNKYLDLDWLPTLIEGNSTIFDDTIYFGTAGTNARDTPHFEIIVGAKHTISWNGDTYECIGKSFPAGNGEFRYVGNAVVSDTLSGAVNEDTGEPFVFYYALDNNGGYNFCTAEGNYTDADVAVAVNVVTPTPNKMPQKYMPESVDHVIINSSTTGSTKKFRLTVNDSGTVTATEVT